MFTVKAVVEGETSDSGHTEIREASRVTVRRARDDGQNGPGSAPYIPGQMEVDIEGGPLGRHVITVGSDRFSHYQAVYVMNERGATVETIRASIPPKALAA